MTTSKIIETPEFYYIEGSHKASIQDQNIVINLYLEGIACGTNLSTRKFNAFCTSWTHDINKRLRFDRYSDAIEVNGLIRNSKKEYNSLPDIFIMEE